MHLCFQVVFTAYIYIMQLDLCVKDSSCAFVAGVGLGPKLADIISQSLMGRKINSLILFSHQSYRCPELQAVL